MAGKTLDLKTGWNLICAPTTTSIAADEMGTVPAEDCPHFYERQGGNYTPVTTLEAGKAYFLKVSNNQTWNIPSEGEKTTFVYDGGGGRVIKVTRNQSTEAREIYIGSLYEERLADSVERIVKKHIFLGSTRICTVENDGAVTKYRYYHQDHIGSSNVITDESGQIVQLIEYSPYGLTTREEGAYNTNYRFTGKLFDKTTDLYYYGARYYDPELGRFIQPDTIVPYPSDPQSFNRYSYCRNNPITYIDPTGHSWKNWIGHLIGTIAGAFITAISGGNVWLGLQTYGFWSGAINSAMSGSWSAFAGGMAGSIVGGAIGIGAAKGIYGALGESSFSFGAGFLGGAAEFGSTGFGAGFGSSLGSGGSFTDAMKSGLIAGGVSAVAGGIIQGSYLAGWQNIVHGTDRATVGKFAGVERKMSLERVRNPLPSILNEAAGGGDPGEHWGLRIRDNYNEFNGTWDFDYIHNFWNDTKVGVGTVPGIAQASNNKTWMYFDIKSEDLQYITKIYGNIQQNLGRHDYNLKSYTCQTWVNNREALRTDNFTR